MISIDLNADLGEGMGSDDALLNIVSSASIACGGHAGDAATIRQVLALCKARGIRPGAHPGYADPAQFGRFRLDIPLEQLLEQIRTQMRLIRVIAAEMGLELAYVKLHGALANQTAEDFELASHLFGAIKAIDSRLAVLALDNSEQVRAAQELEMPVIREAYADRAYTPAGMLVARSEPGAVIHDREAVIERCLRLALAGEIVAADGTVLASLARSICLHGDTPGAVELGRAVRKALEAAGVVVQPEPALA